MDPGPRADDYPESMMTSGEERRAESGDVILRALRLGLHISVAAMLLVGVGRVVDGEADLVRRVGVMAVAAVFAVVYLGGTLVEKRAAEGTIQAPGRGLALIWLATVTLLWAMLLCLASDFAWLAFPLFFLHLHLLRPAIGVPVIAVLTASVAVVLWHQPGGAHAATVVGPATGAVFAVLMAQAYRVLHRENRALRETLEDLRRTREQLADSQRTAGALAERERLAREIHDTLAQGLSSIVLVSRAASSSLEAGAVGDARDQVGTVRRTAGENLQEARRFVAALQTGQQREPAMLDELRGTCRQIEAQAAASGAELRCRLHVEGEPRPVSGGQALVVLRVVQASLANVLAHAQAGEAVVTLTFVEDELLVDVVDDGIGFDADRAAADGAARNDGTGYGMRSLRERVVAQGGTFVVESAPGEGTTVTARLPSAPVPAEKVS